MTKQKKKLLQQLLKQFNDEIKDYQIIKEQGSKTDTSRLEKLEQKMINYLQLAMKFAILRKKEMRTLTQDTVDNWTGMDMPHFMDMLHKLFMAYNNGNLVNKAGLIQYFKQ